MFSEWNGVNGGYSFVYVCFVSDYFCVFDSDLLFRILKSMEEMMELTNKQEWKNVLFCTHAFKTYAEGKPWPTAGDKRARR
jgi:hypothetical protein